MATSYKNPTEAATGLGSAFNPTGSMLTPTQIAAINKAASLVPITPSAIAPSTPITLPQQKPDTTNYQRMVAGGNATVGANNTTLTSTNQPSLDKSYQELLTSLGSVTSADQYNTDYNASGIASSQSDFNAKQQSVLDAQSRLSAINAQLAGITAEGQVSNIKSEGRQVPTFVIAGEQAQQNREYAIKALPLQAQALGAQAEVAAAQGNAALSQSILQQAQDHLDKVFQIHQTDNTNQYNRKKDLLDSIYSSLSAREKVRADTIQKEDDRKFTLKRDAINQQNDLAKTAIENGQGALAGRIAGLSADSPTFQADLTKLTGQIRPKSEKASAGGTGSNSIANAVDSGLPIPSVTDPTKTVAQNNIKTLQGIFQSSKVSAGNKTSIGNGLALAQAAQDLADANVDGSFSGFSPFRAVTDIKIPFTNIGLPFREALKRNKTIQNEALISALDLQTQFWASGAALSDAQTELVKKMIPTVNNTDTQIRTKVNQLINYMLSQTASRLVTDGIDYKPVKVDMFETVNLLEKASPEQLKQLQAAGLTQ